MTSDLAMAGLAAWCAWALLSGGRVLARRHRRHPRIYDWARDGECDNRSHPRSDPVKVRAEGGFRAMTLDCHEGGHDRCTGVTVRVAKGLSPTPCECRCHASRPTWLDGCLTSSGSGLWVPGAPRMPTLLTLNTARAHPLAHVGQAHGGVAGAGPRWRPSSARARPDLSGGRRVHIEALPVQGPGGTLADPGGHMPTLKACVRTGSGTLRGSPMTQGSTCPR